ncbi:hypothetical protein NT6N_04250 [Oceaniferula spumae]|uniref:DUF304 domain-containing protein n=1 Tax=Oceaniferula spumae TaxID=2979115 RepID=A0AAT9FHE7_9BACT
MEALLSEDDAIRELRLKAVRKLCYSVIRTLIIFGLPICIAFSVWFYNVEPENTFLYIAPLMVVPFLMLIFVLLPYLSARVHNRWLIKDGTIRLKGEVAGKISMARLAEWTIKPYSDLEGYYNLSISSRNRLNGASLILSESDHSIDSINAMFPSKNVAEQGASSDR